MSWQEFQSLTINFPLSAIGCTKRQDIEEFIIAPGLHRIKVKWQMRTFFQVDVIKVHEVCFYAHVWCLPHLASDVALYALKNFVREQKTHGVLDYHSNTNVQNCHNQ